MAANLEDPKAAKVKVSKGVDFIQTQPIFDVEILSKFTKGISGLNVPVIAGILPLASLKHAEFIHNEVPGITIPEEVMGRMRKGTPDEGLKIAQELLNEIKGVCQGARIMPPFRKYEMIEKLIH